MNALIPSWRIFPYLLKIMTGVATSGNLLSGYVGYKSLRLELGDGVPSQLMWGEHYPEQEGGIAEFSLVTFSSWSPKRYASAVCHDTW